MDISRTSRAGLIALAAIGSAAFLLTRLRPKRRRLAHRADGADDSASYAAGIADEGTIPDADPLLRSPTAEAAVA